MKICIVLCYYKDKMESWDTGTNELGLCASPEVAWKLIEQRYEELLRDISAWAMPGEDLQGQVEVLVQNQGFSIEDEYCYESYYFVEREVIEEL